VLMAASVDTGVSHFDSLAKYLAASFKKSRSSLTPGLVLYRDQEKHFRHRVLERPRANA
jgi:hypothetical protein